MGLKLMTDRHPWITSHRYPLHHTAPFVPNISIACDLLLSVEQRMFKMFHQRANKSLIFGLSHELKSADSALQQFS